MINFQVIKDLSELPAFDDSPVFADIETDGLYINTRLVQVYQPTTDPMIYIIDIDYVDLDEVKEWLQPLWLVFYRGSYDLGTLNMVPNKMDDLIYLVKMAYPEFKKYSLDLTMKNLGMEYLYADLDKKALQKAGFILGSYLSKEQLRYSATDVKALELIWNLPKIVAARELTAYKVDMLSQRYAIQYQQNGLISNRKMVRDEIDNLQEDIKANYISLGGVNCNSPKQCREALGTGSSDKPTLIRLISQDNQLAEAIFKQRRLLKKEKMLTTYNKPKVHTRYDIYGAATGRFTATGKDLPDGINAQQIPRDLQYIFNQPYKGTVVIEADYSTVELRAACSIMKEPVMYKELLDGIDLHMVSASLVTGKKPEDHDKQERIKGKAVSFGFIFGMSAPSFQEYAFTNFGVKFTEQEAKDIKTKYQRHYPTIARYHEYMWRNYKKSGFTVETALGRKVKPNLGTDAINIPTQGSTAETMKLAIHYMVKEDPKVLGVIANVVHDSISLRVPEEDKEYWTEFLERNMLKGWSEISKTALMFFKDIPMIVDVEHAY